MANSPFVKQLIGIITRNWVKHNNFFSKLLSNRVQEEDLETTGQKVGLLSIASCSLTIEYASLFACQKCLKTRSVFERHNIVSDQDLKEAARKMQTYHEKLNGGVEIQESKPGEVVQLKEAQNG